MYYNFEHVKLSFFEYFHECIFDIMKMFIEVPCCQIYKISLLLALQKSVFLSINLLQNGKTYRK